MFSQFSSSPSLVASVSSFEDLYGELRLEKIDLPELGGKTVYMRQLSAAEVREFVLARGSDTSEISEASFSGQDRMIARALVDASGNRIVPEGQEHLLSTLPYRVYLRLANAVTAGMNESGGEEDGKEGAENPTT